MYVCRYAFIYTTMKFAGVPVAYWFHRILYEIYHHGVNVVCYSFRFKNSVMDSPLGQHNRPFWYFWSHLVLLFPDRPLNSCWSIRSFSTFYANIHIQSLFMVAPIVIYFLVADYYYKMFSILRSSRLYSCPLSMFPQILIITVCRRLAFDKNRLFRLCLYSKRNHNQSLLFT